MIFCLTSEYDNHKRVTETGITISHGSFVFSQSRVKVSSSLTKAGSQAVGAFDLVNCSLSVVRFIPVLNVGQCCKVVVGL